MFSKERLKGSKENNWDEIKQLASNASTKIIQLQTLYPRVNNFYSKNDAKFLCDSRYYDEETEKSHHSSVMTIKL